METRRIGLYGGPGSGKSTTAHFIVWKLKTMGIATEFVGERVKKAAYAKADIHPIIDQFSITGAQIQDEMEMIQTGAVVVTESPVLLGAAYAYSMEERQVIRRVVQSIEEQHPGLHLFINRGNKSYDPIGRWGDFDHARSIDELIEAEMTSAFGQPPHGFRVIRYGDWDALTEIVEEFGRRLQE